MNDYVHIEAADLRRPNARFTTERQGYQVLTPFGKLGYSQLFYRTGSEVVAVQISEGPPSTWGSPIALFADQYFPRQPGYSRYYDVAPDGRFLMILDTSVEGEDLVFVEHWVEELNRLVPTN